MSSSMGKYSDNRIFGIDLGTTFSSIAYVNDFGVPKIVRNKEGHHTTPSVVFIDGNIVRVGLAAVEAAKDYPENVISYVKRSINDPSFCFENMGRRFSVEEISSFILRKLVGDAEEQVGCKIKNVVITCPAYFGINERESVRLAGEIAGLNVRQIISEPTAAAIAYGAAEMQEPKKIVVYDLGGGTFDITMIDIRPKSIKVIGTGGDPRLGGKDWNDRMMEFVAEEFYKETGFDPVEYNILEDYATHWDIHDQVEKAKKSYVTSQKAKIGFSYLEKDFDIEVTRDIFNAITKDLIAKTLGITSGMLKDARKKGYTRFDEIILVGGSSYLGQVAKGINDKFGIEPKLYHPEEAIARGAAIFGWKLFLRDRLVERIAKKVEIKMDLGEFADNLEKVARKAEGKAPSLDDLESGLELTMDTSFDPSERGSKLRSAKKVLDEELSGIDIDVPGNVIEEAVKEVGEDTGFAVAAVRNSMMEIQDVVCKSMGFLTKAKDGHETVFIVIPKNKVLPAFGEKVFATAVPGQKGIQLRLVESEEDDEWVAVEQTAEIGRAWVMLPPDLPAKTALKITFALNKEGRLKMTATESFKGRKIDFTIKTSSVISGEDLAAAKARRDSIMVS